MLKEAAKGEKINKESKSMTIRQVSDNRGKIENLLMFTKTRNLNTGKKRIFMKTENYYFDKKQFKE